MLITVSKKRAISVDDYPGYGYIRGMFGLPEKYMMIKIAEIRSKDNDDDGWVWYTSGTTINISQTTGVTSTSTSTNTTPYWSTGTSSILGSSIGNIFGQSNQTWPYVYHLVAPEMDYTISSRVPIKELVDVDTTELGCKILSLARTLLWSK
jgi:hypothetical protein